MTSQFCWLIATWLVAKAGSKSRPKISGPGYSNGLLDTQKCAVLFVLHFIVMQKVYTVVQYMQKVKINRNAVSVLNS